MRKTAEKNISKTETSPCRKEFPFSTSRDYFLRLAVGFPSLTSYFHAGLTRRQFPLEKDVKGMLVIQWYFHND